MSHALTTGTSSQHVVYCGVRRSCFMPQSLCVLAVPALEHRSRLLDGPRASAPSG